MIKFEDVRSSYTGKIGCCCGCIGNHYIASHVTNRNDHDVVSDRAVKIAINKLNKLIDWDNPIDVALHVNKEYADYDTDTRTIIVYFK